MSTQILPNSDRVFLIFYPKSTWNANLLQNLTQLGWGWAESKCGSPLWCAELDFQLDGLNMQHGQVRLSVVGRAHTFRLGLTQEHAHEVAEMGQAVVGLAE